MHQIGDNLKHSYSK